MKIILKYETITLDLKLYISIIFFECMYKVFVSFPIEYVWRYNLVL